MGPVNWLAVVLGAVAFFAVGSLWYGVLFGKVWQREAGMDDAKVQGGNMAVTFGLCFLLQLIVSATFGHNLARIAPPPHVVMMMAFGFGATLMVPAIGINYLFQRQSLKLFLIDAGHLVLGTLAMGSVFVVIGY